MLVFPVYEECFLRLQLWILHSLARTTQRGQREQKPGLLLSSSWITKVNGVLYRNIIQMRFFLITERVWDGWPWRRRFLMPQEQKKSLCNFRMTGMMFNEVIIENKLRFWQLLQTIFLWSTRRNFRLSRCEYEDTLQKLLQRTSLHRTILISKVRSRIHSLQ